MVEVASLLVLPFAHEDLAIVLGAYAIVNDILPIGLVTATLYGGIVISDIALYGLGAAARRIPWVRRWTIGERVTGYGDKLKENVFWLVALCRVVPGTIFFAFVACGWTGVSLRRFSAASLLVSALYLPMMLMLTIVFGDRLNDLVGVWTWPLLLAGLVGTGLMRKQLFSPEAGGGAVMAAPAVLDALPSPTAAGARVAAAERIPPLLFYAPLAASWLALGARYRSLTLPACANPMIETGGMWGESKSDYFHQVAPDQRRWLAAFAVVRRSAGADGAGHDLHGALRRIDEAGLAFPLVAKPDVGWHGHGVRVIADAVQLYDYIGGFPAGETLILQALVPYAGEAAVLYARKPGEACGRIESLTFRYAPHVVGDGEASVRDLIRRDPRARWKARLHLGRDPTHRSLGAAELARVPAAGELVQLAFVGNQRAGGIYRDARRYVTPALTARFDGICRSMPEFHYGRFDIRFASAGALAAGEEFAIVEINGIGGEAIDVWDPDLSIGEAYRRLYRQQALLFEIGDRNRQRGFVPPGPVAFLRPALQQSRLIDRYPASQ